jgi:alkanesulfonate monooxygenase SsuD/methylene tetrahydromethanopterin reductase-like flavin-dependent oxidoreductase (luciferase family)
MVELTLHFDFRAPDIGPPPAELYRTAVDMAAWGDAQGFDRVVISSHHGCEDNYGSAPLIEATAVALRTKAIRIQPVVTLTLYDPLHLAEDVAVLDLLSGGRIDLVVAAGYRPSEFAMFGRSMSQRAALMEEGVPALRRAWTGEPFEFRGETVLVTPRPLQAGGPRIIMTGDTRAAAERAARLGDDYMPMTGGTSRDDYVSACAALGKTPAPASRQPSWMFLWVTLDPDRAWRQLAPHLLHVTNSYGEWMAEAGTTAVYRPATEIDDLRASGTFRIVTPEQCIELAQEVDSLMFDPLFGGIPPELAWEALELAAKTVFPALRGGG